MLFCSPPEGPARSAHALSAKPMESPMEPFLAPLIAGGASLLGSMFTANTSASNTQAQLQAQEQMQAQTEQFNASQAQINRDFQQQMSSTAYQRSAADMKAAGLNPMMMFGSGGPASVPSGSTAAVGTPSVPAPTKSSALSGLGPAVSQAMSTAVQMKTLDESSSRIAEKDLQIKDLQRQLDAGGPEKRIAAIEAATNLDKQTRDIRIPEQSRGTGYTWLPEALRNADVYVDPIRRGAGAVGDVVGMFPKGVVKGAIEGVTGNSAKGLDTKFPGGVGATYGNPSPSMRQSAKDAIRDAMKDWDPRSAKGLRQY